MTGKTLKLYSDNEFKPFSKTDNSAKAQQNMLKIFLITD